MRRLAWLALVVVLLTKSVAYAAGGSIPRTGPVFLVRTSSSLEDLTCFQERVGGYFIDRETFMFYAGDTDAFQAFLDKYAKADDIEGRRLVIHEGKGTSRAPWDRDKGKPCDWMLKVVTAWIELAPDEDTRRPSSEGSR